MDKSRIQKLDTEIKAENLAFEYIRRDENENVVDIVRALDNISIELKKGLFLAVLGQNGCGKSTFARHLNCLLTPTEGTLWVYGMDTGDALNTLKIRKEVGMVFQNPDNQIIGTTVEEDVAFGLENLGVETAQIWNRVGQSLQRLGMDNVRYSSPNKLSGGQKQKVAIAGILAMQPGCIVLDEATAMLDPKGRKEVLEAVSELNRKENITIILITHYMEEALYAQQAIVMDQGSIVLAGTPKEIFSEEAKLKELSLEVPPVAEIANHLRILGLPLKKGIVEEQEFIQEMKKIYQLSAEEKHSFFARAENYLYKEEIEQKTEQEMEQKKREGQRESKIVANIPLLTMDQVCYTYDKIKKTKKAKKADKGQSYSNTNPNTYAVDHISLSIYSGEFLALTGHTGSGKSTLLQIMNGLLKADSGTVYYKGQDIYDSSFSLPKLRHSIGLVFQYPEYQLFETTVVKDVMYGPKNQGLPQLQAQLHTFEALKLAGIGEDLFDVSPFDLSGGQKRRAAIAGVLAMKPELMILDEPAAGLDPQGRRGLFQMLRDIHKKTGMAVLLVSHSMEDVVEYADRILVMQEGRLLFDDKPQEVFSHKEELRAAGLELPAAARLIEQMNSEKILEGKAAYTERQAVYRMIHALQNP